MASALSTVEPVDRPTKTTASIPADLYGQMWQFIARARTRGQKLTVQQILITALRDYLLKEAKDAAA
jgi:hypothetical protein